MLQKEINKYICSQLKLDLLVSHYISSALLQDSTLKSQRLLIFCTWWAHAFLRSLPCCNSGCCSYNDIMHLQSMLQWHLCSDSTLMRRLGDSCLFSSCSRVTYRCTALELSKQKLLMARGGSITSHG